MTDLEESNTSNNTFLIVNHEQRFEIFFNSSIFFALLNCIALLILLTISCLVACLWLSMLLCCRDSAGIVEDVQDSMGEVKNEEHTENNHSKKPSVINKYQTTDTAGDNKELQFIEHPSLIT